MTEAQRKSAVRRKRAAGNPGGKPTNVRTFARKKMVQKKYQNPKGGLNKAGRAYFKELLVLT